MSEEITTGDVEPAQNTTEETNMTVSQFANRRAGLMGQGQETEADESQENTEEVSEVEEEAQEVDESTEEVSEENVLSQLDIDNLSEGELQELAEKLGSRAVARFGEMTARRKAAEERANELESLLQQKQQSLSKKEIKDNPFSDLDSVEAIQNKQDEIESTIEWAEETLFESDDYSAEDVVTEIDGKDLTKKEVRKLLLNARKAQKEYIPDQLNKVQTQLSGKQLQKQYDTKAREELEWLATEDPSETRDQFFATLRDPQYNKLKKILDKELPQVSGQLEYMFAHAANSIYGRKVINESKPSKVTGKTPSLTPTRTANTSSAKSEKPNSKTSKALKDLQARFKQTGQASDYAAMRKLQLQIR